MAIGAQTATSLPPAPRVFWTFWDSEALPRLVQACQASWRRFHPDFAIVTLTPVTLAEHFLNLDRDFRWATTAARKADVARAFVVSAYGGVWLDATMMLVRPLTFMEPVLAEQGPQFTGFYIPGPTKVPCWPVVESWAFAARPGAVFMDRWKKVFFDVPNHAEGVTEALHELVNTKGVDVQGIGIPHYLFIHVAAQAVLQTDAPDLSLLLFNCESSGGPFAYLAHVAWDSRKALDIVLRHAAGSDTYHAFKLRGAEWRLLTEEEVSVLVDSQTMGSKGSEGTGAHGAVGNTLQPIL